MMGISGVCSKIIGELVQVLKVSRSNSTQMAPISASCKPQSSERRELLLQALTAVFGMETNGKIKKEKARRVVENLGLIYGEEEKSSFDLPGEEEVPVEEALGDLEDEKKRNELLREAFKIFDEDGNGFIEAKELKRVLERLGLDKGWDISEIEKMLQVVDVNLDGKVDFTEFELMMG